MKNITNKHIDIYKLLKEGVKYSEISKRLSVSLGVINSVSKMNINLDELKIERAIIWVAGWGSRLMPITTKTPKPLVKAQGLSFLESIILSLKKSNINDIFIVVGRQKESFQKIINKYDLKVINNSVWEKHNNISSYYSAIKILKKNTYLIDGDLFIQKDFEFRKYAINSFAISSFVKKSNDLLFEKKGRYIQNIYKGNSKPGNQYKGVFFFKKKDLETLNKKVLEQYDINREYESRYWFDILFDHCMDKIKLENQSIEFNDIYEVDDIKDLIKIDSSYKNWKERKW